MILHNISIAGRPGNYHLQISDGQIRTITEDSEALDLSDKTRIPLSGMLALPGLINSHDHLDFNLFPQFGGRTYSNYTQWATDIHDRFKNEIQAVVNIPMDLRIQWGMYKNLLNGFTTVVNHGKQINITDPLIDVFQDCYSLHSTFFEKGWRKKINHPFRSHKPFVMHLGEGTDPISFNEIDAVAKSNFFRRKIIAIHGVAMNEKQAAAFHGLVWCPASNYLLLGKTAAIDHLMKKTRVVFGTDSTLTASGNAWKQFRQGIETRMVTEEQLLSMLTNEPAQLWGLQDRGMIEENKRADLIIVPQTDQLFALDPKDLLLVISKGKLVLYDESIENTDKSFDSIVIGGRRKYVAGNISSLIESIKRYDVDVSLA